MLRVLLITGSYPPMKCGVGSYTKRLAMALAECQEVKVTVLTDERAHEAEKQDGIEVLSVISGWRIAELVRIIKCITESNPDIIQLLRWGSQVIKHTSRKPSTNFRCLEKKA